MFATSVFLLRTTEVSTVFISFYVAISYDTLAIVQQVYTTLIRVFLLRTTELLSNRLWAPLRTKASVVD